MDSHGKGSLENQGTGEASKIDGEHIKSIISACGDNGALIMEMFAAFESNTPQLLVNLRKSFNEGDSRQVRYYAHKVKGSASNLGLTLVCQIARKIEEPEDPLKVIGINDIDCLEKACYEIKDHLKAYLDSLNLSSPH